MRISYITLGCKVNQYETQAIEKLLTERGHKTAGRDEPTDAVVINTCAVTGESARKSRQTIRHAKKKNPDALLIITGCFSQSEQAEAAELGADFIGGAGERMQIVHFLEREQPASLTPEDPFARRTFEELPAGETDGRTRALLKIQDGCTNFCSYCIIPYLRGPSRSLPLRQAVLRAGELAARGFAEIVLTGIEISSYSDLDGSGLIELTEEICRASGSARVRLGSLEPSLIDEGIVKRLSELPNLCPHFHLSLQSGSDTVLRRMRRKYTTEQFAEAVSLLREYFPNPAITTDLIVGFPGESEEEFAESLRFLRRIRFSAVHIFPYSVRKGTRAAQMDGQIQKQEKEHRAAAAAAVRDETRREYLSEQTGKTLHVLVETERGHKLLGHSENYLETEFRGTGLRGCVLPVRIIGNDGDRLFGELL